MSLTELAAEYKDSGDKCTARVRELRIQLMSEPMSESARIMLRRRITILTGMGRQAHDIARYLKNYYGVKHEPQADKGA